jgi:hypothetical protein
MAKIDEQVLKDAAKSLSIEGEFVDRIDENLSVYKEGDTFVLRDNDGNFVSTCPCVDTVDIDE